MHHQNSNDRIPDLFRYKLNYQKHKSKLGQLNRRHSYNNSCNRQQIIDQYRLRKQQSFNRRTFNTDKKIQNENSFIYDKLTKGTRSSIAPFSHSLDGRLTHESLRKRVQMKTDKDNQQIYNKLNKLAPSINNKKLESDYEKSVKIRNRISRFEKNESRNTSTLKLNRYFQLSSRSTPSSRREIQPLNLPPADSRDTRYSSTQKGFQTPPSKLATFKSKMNVEYNREDINKNKIVDKWDMVKKKKYHSMFKQPISQQMNKEKMSEDIIMRNKEKLSNDYGSKRRVISNDQVFPTEA